VFVLDPNKSLNSDLLEQYKDIKLYPAIIILFLVVYE